MNIDEIREKYGIQHNDAKGDGHTQESRWNREWQRMLSGKETPQDLEKRKKRQDARNTGFKSADAAKEILKASEEIKKLYEKTDNALSSIRQRFKILKETKGYEQLHLKVVNSLANLSNFVYTYGLHQSRMTGKPW